LFGCVCTFPTVAVPAGAQTTAASEWTWMGGSNWINQPGVYGALATPAANNVPGSRLDAVSWTDSSGHLWLFGGGAYDVNGDYGYVNDLWKFNPSTTEWAWIAGSNTVGSSGSQPGVYGTLGTPAAGNTPGGRANAVSWADSGGHLWLFGGWNLLPSGGGLLNDVWEFNPSTDEWSWMGGSSTVDQRGEYGTLGSAANGNVPGSRYEAVSWTDRGGNLWLFGGIGYDANGHPCAHERHKERQTSEFRAVDRPPGRNVSNITSRKHLRQTRQSPIGACVTFESVRNRSSTVSS
jgi:hypothetical protein